MRCIGRRKDFLRCKNNAKYFFCYKHRFQAVAFLMSALGLIGLFGGIYWDIIVPVFKKKDPVQYTVQDTSNFKAVDVIPYMDSIVDLKIKKEALQNNSNLKVVDVSTYRDSIIDFKLQNSGNGVAYIKGVQFVFGPIHCGSNLCNPLLYFVRYYYDFDLRYLGVVSKYKGRIVGTDSLKTTKQSSFWNLSSDSIDKYDTAFKVSTEPIKIKKYSEKQVIAELNKEYVSIADKVLKLENFHWYPEPKYFAIKKSPTLRISQIVKAKDVDRFQISINFNKELILSDCINSCGFQAYALIFYDENKILKTNRFEIGFSNIDEINKKTRRQIDSIRETLPKQPLNPKISQ